MSVLVFGLHKNSFGSWSWTVSAPICHHRNIDQTIDTYRRGQQTKLKQWDIEMDIVCPFHHYPILKKDNMITFSALDTRTNTIVYRIAIIRED
jgi:hypothetical protein